MMMMMIITLLKSQIYQDELAFGIATFVGNNVIFIFNVLIKVLLLMHKGEIMQHCSGHNNNEGIRQGGA